ncbi:MAG: alpha/beta fold hydrolase [Desulfobacterales bacterium]|nr:alpha/beta fold hydrolase [Desulfobacterales bacterium]
MNRYAYLTTGLAIKAISELSKAKVIINGSEKIPKGSIVFVINHFTRIETIFLPYHINNITERPIWSLADYSLFQGSLARFLDKVGAISTKNPDRDLLIVKSLLTGEANWIIFPEGRMVKNKKIYEKKYKQGKFIISSEEGKHLPHTGAAALALRTEFYRERFKKMLEINPYEIARLMELYQIESIEPVFRRQTYIVPVNITYYPLRAKENLLSRLAGRFISTLSDRMKEEIMIESTMLLSGVDVDIRFGEAIEIKQYLNNPSIKKDISSKEKINFDDQISSLPIMKKSASDIMQRYMSAIYNMTTVNHDHIFASMLKLMPMDKIDQDDLKKRVYFFCSCALQKTAVFHHTSLDINQIHLLTDDRYKKFENFLALSAQTNIVKKKKNILIKDNSKFSFEDFHKVRIDNPIAVMANEVEPLSEFQDNIRRIALQPTLRIKNWITECLIDKALTEYEKDYGDFYRAGESKDKDVGKPILLKGESKEMGILLIHGYMAAPLELKELALYLNQKGLWVYVPRLKGHGTSPDDLAIRNHLEWIESVEEGYGIISNICKNVVVGGFSTGAGLALDLAARVKEISGVISVSPPFKLIDLSAMFVPVINVWNKFAGMFNLKKAKKEFVKNNPENPHINYHRNPLKGMGELEKLMDMVSSKLHKIEIPTLLIQSHKDPVVDPASSRKVFEKIKSPDKEFILINYDRHGILIGQGAERIYRAIFNFINKL